MAIFKWVGNTGTSQTKFDWNTASNWYKRLFGPPNGTPIYVQATAAPGPFDEVWVGLPIDPRDGQSLPYIEDAPFPLSPLLYGGFSGTVAGGTWINSSQPFGGHTFNTSCSRITINVIHEERDSPGGNTYTTIRLHYPFDFIGGGLTGEMLAYAQSYGVTLFDLSDIRTQSLKLKSNSYSITARGDSPSSIQGFSLGYSPIRVEITAVKSLVQLGGGTGSAAGSSGPTIPLVESNLWAAYNGTFILNGGVFSRLELRGEETTQFQNPKPGKAAIINTVFDTGLVTHQAKNSFIGCTGNYLRYGLYGPGVIPWVKGSGLYFDGTLDTTYILNEIFPLGGITGPPRYRDNVLEIIALAPPHQGDFTNTYPIEIGDVFDNNRKYIGYIDAGGYPSESDNCKYNITFVGPVSVSTMRCSYHNILANVTPNISSNSVNIGTLHLKNSATLNFRATKIGYNSFDFWYFGATAGNNGISGGIIFDDDSSKILGSEGIRLYNTKLKASNKADSRLSSVISTTKLPISGVGDTQV